jgi:peroxiredoxin Q/BCP
MAKLIVAVFVAAVCVVVLWLLARPRQPIPEKGREAPDFSLPDQEGRAHRLADYRGRWVVLYFYPRDDTPGCTTEACSFRDGFLDFKKRGVEIVGISVDTPASHAAFAERHRLPFTLLADSGGEVAERYGVLWQLGPWRFAARRTFVIDPAGRVALRYRRVRPGVHGGRVLQDLDALNAQGVGHP